MSPCRSLLLRQGLHCWETVVYGQRMTHSRRSCAVGLPLPLAHSAAASQVVSQGPWRRFSLSGPHAASARARARARLPALPGWTRSSLHSYGAGRGPPVLPGVLISPAGMRIREPHLNRDPWISTPTSDDGFRMASASALMRGGAGPAMMHWREREAGREGSPQN